MIWKVCYIEVSGNDLLSLQTRVLAQTKEIAEGKIRRNNNMLITSVEPLKSTGHKKMVVCRARGACCTICGSYFPGGDDICAYGHRLGMKYPIS